MKKIYLLNLLSLIWLMQGFSEENKTYKLTPFTFNRIENDTLDNLIHKIGKDSLLHILDKRIKNATEVVKGKTSHIKTEITIPEIICLNKHFNLNLDSFLLFREEVQSYKDLPFTLYGEKMITKDYDEISNFIKQNKDNKKYLLEQFYGNIFHLGGKTGLIAYCNLLTGIIDQSTLDSLYQIAQFYPANLRNEYYFTLIEYDKNCGNEETKSAYYKKKMYDNLYPVLNLVDALTDTAELNNINYLKYTLDKKYEFFAYSLYAHDFDIKNHQPEVIYFLTSQDKYGGFKQLNINTDEFSSGAESSVYGLWALIELRSQIDKLYPKKL